MELDEVKELSKQLSDAKTELVKQQTELKDAHKLAMEAVQKAADMSQTTKDNIDKAISAANEQGLQVKELAQKLDELTKSVKAGPVKPLTFREELLKSIDGQKDSYEKLIRREANNLRLVAKSIGMPQIPGLIANPYVDTLVDLPKQPLRIRNLLTEIPVQTETVRYGQQTLRTNAATGVAEGTSKPYSAYAWSNNIITLEVIAHLAKLTLQAIADAPRLVAEVESEMRYGLALAEEHQLLTGNGTSPNLHGLLPNSTAYAIPAGANGLNILTPLDELRIAILQLHLAFVSPDAHIMNPIDLANIELTRRDAPTAKTGGYLYNEVNAPAGVTNVDGQLTLWRLPAVESVSMPVNTFMTGAFKYATSLYTRQGVEVLISTENDVDFEKNQATMRCEERMGLAVRRPYALINGTFGVAS